ncbi:MAG: hypothetical protein ACLFSU_05140 [Acholeplasmataceae bacterium]
MSRVKKNQVMVLVTSFVVFSIFGLFLIYELTDTPDGPKDQEHIELRDRINDYLEGGTLKYDLERHAVKETYIRVSYDQENNTMRYSFHNWVAGDQKKAALEATVVLIDLVLKGENDMDIRVEGGLHSRGSRLLTVEASHRDVLVVDIEGSNHPWAMKMSFSLES